ncbi:MAG: transcriptional regulator [Oscillospiraceae bacterium]|nr:transcriptional regulator [Oscillospiraceae bacterium]
MNNIAGNTKTQNDTAWEALFEKHDILNEIECNGRYIITATNIKEYREPRLMAKFDSYINLPGIFKKHHLAILPISRGSYLISHFDAYMPTYTSTSRVIKKTLPHHLESLSVNNVTTETVAINMALASGMLHDFLDEETFYSTVSGRMGSGRFEFLLENSKTKEISTVEVINSQIEIDLALEGIRTLALLEAKLDLANDFLIRQLYYPYRVWSSRVTKPVKPVFLVYSNGIYSLSEYMFLDPNVYNSLVLVKHMNYTLEDRTIEMTDLLRIVNEITVYTLEPATPFPQADKFERVINICELLSNRIMSRDEITEEYAFDVRQTNYYTDAAIYLGLVQKEYEAVSRKPSYALTDLGKRITNMEHKQRQLSLAKCILEHKVFLDSFLATDKGVIPDRQAIVQIMKQSSLYGIVSDHTYYRRAQTISGWLNWIFRLVSNQ